MAKKIQLNKKALRVLSVDEIEVVAGGAEDVSDTSLRTISGPQPTLLVADTTPTSTDPDPTA